MVLGLEGTGELGAPLAKGTACRAPTGVEGGGRAGPRGGGGGWGGGGGKV